MRSNRPVKSAQSIGTCTVVQVGDAVAGIIKNNDDVLGAAGQAREVSDQVIALRGRIAPRAVRSIRRRGGTHILQCKTFIIVQEFTVDIGEPGADIGRRVGGILY